MGVAQPILRWTTLRKTALASTTTVVDAGDFSNFKSGKYLVSLSNASEFRYFEIIAFKNNGQICYNINNIQGDILQTDINFTQVGSEFFLNLVNYESTPLNISIVKTLLK